MSKVPTLTDFLCYFETSALHNSIFYLSAITVWCDVTSFIATGCLQRHLDT